MKWYEKIAAIATLLMGFYGLMLYMYSADMDANIAWMAWYHYNETWTLAVAGNGTSDLALYHMQEAWHWCDLYNVERRTLDQHYADMCREIMNSTGKVMLMAPSVMKVNFPGEKPYFSWVFSQDYIGLKCKQQGSTWAYKCMGVA